jgi:hypothetical protein
LCFPEPEFSLGTLLLLNAVRLPKGFETTDSAGQKKNAAALVAIGAGVARIVSRKKSRKKEESDSDKMPQLDFSR